MTDTDMEADWLGESSVKEEIETPAHGWDSPLDVHALKNIVEDQRPLFSTVKKDLADKVIEGLIREAHALGIATETACPMLYKACKNFRREIDLLHEFEQTYRHAGRPGLASKAGKAKIDLTKAEEASEEYNWDFKHKWPRPIIYAEKENASKCAAVFLDRCPYVLVYAHGEFYECRNRIWVKKPKNALANDIRHTNPDCALDQTKIAKMVRSLEISQYVDVMPYEWIDEPTGAPESRDLILFANGMLNVATGELLPLSPAYFATSTPAFGYDPDATCELWQAKLDEWLPKPLQDTLQEAIGYLMTPDTSYETILTLIGPTRSGKGTIFRVIECLVGKDHFVSRMMADLGGEFGLQGVEDKLVMLIPDAANIVAANRGKAVERLKSISGQDTVSINRKNMTIINRQVKTRIVMAGNQHPKFKDESTALALRQIIIPFTRSFKGREDTGLRDRLLRELPGVANWALAGLRRLREQRHFTISKEGQAAVDALAESQSAPLRFAKTALIITGKLTDFADRDAIWDQWCDWAKGEQLHPSDQYDRTGFQGALLSAIGHRGVGYSRVRRSGKRGRFYIGVKLKRPPPSLEDDGADF